MPGRIPNSDRDPRERKNGWTTLPAEPDLPPAPTLMGGHTDRGRFQWAAWWATPMALMWLQSDAIALERCLDLHEQRWAIESKGEVPPGFILAEIRHIEDRFGLTPQGRRKLYWQVEGVDIEVKADPAEGRLPGSPFPRAGGADDPRLR